MGRKKALFITLDTRIMELEVGSTYKNRIGEVRTVQAVLSRRNRLQQFGFRVKDDRGDVYRKNGTTFSRPKKDSPFDLIEKVKGRNAWD